MSGDDPILWELSGMHLDVVGDIMNLVDSILDEAKGVEEIKIIDFLRKCTSLPLLPPQLNTPNLQTPASSCKSLHNPHSASRWKILRCTHPVILEGLKREQ